MRTITVTKAGKLLALDREGDDAITGDRAFLNRVFERIDKAPIGYDPDRLATAMREEAEAIGAEFNQVGELEPPPDDGVA